MSKRDVTASKVNLFMGCNITIDFVLLHLDKNICAENMRISENIEPKIHIKV